VPIDVTVEEPRARVVSEEPNRYQVRSTSASAHDITNDGVVKVVGRIPSTTDYVERMLVRKRKHLRGEWAARTHITTYAVQVNRMLMERVNKDDKALNE
jgi:hypothetical protein